MPSQSNITLESFSVSDETINDYFHSIIKNKPSLKDLAFIFNVAMHDKSLFPNIRLSDDAVYSDYIDKWVRGYEEAMQNPPSKRTATPKGSCSDPAIQTIVQIATNADDAMTNRMVAYHNLFMSAENIQGNLLEEFISNAVRPYGWIWCQGNVLRAIDFAHLTARCYYRSKINQIPKTVPQVQSDPELI